MATQQTFEFLDDGAARLVPPPPFQPDRVGTEDFAVPERPGRPTATARDPKPVPDLDSEDSRARVLRRLRAEVNCIHTVPDQETEIFSTGSDAMDDLLPRGGLRPNAITEWVAEADGCGAATLAMIAAASRLNSSTGHSVCRGPLVVVGSFYPPAAVALGISAERILWLRPTRKADFVWAIDQALRCQSVAAVWASIGADLDDRDARRFQLAAETGHTPGLFIRPAAVRGRPTFADVRLHVDNPSRVDSTGCTVVESPERAGRLMKVTVDRCRGGAAGLGVWVRIDDQARIHKGVCHETAAVRLASELAHPKASTGRIGRRRA